MRKLTFSALLCLASFCTTAEDETLGQILNGKWQCVQQFNLTEHVIFKAQAIAHYSVEKGIVTSEGTITTFIVDEPTERSVLKVEAIDSISIQGNEITFLPLDIQAEVLENGLGELTEDFVSGFENHKEKTTAKATVISNDELHIKYHTGYTAKCLRA